MIRLIEHTVLSGVLMLKKMAPVISYFYNTVTNSVTFALFVFVLYKLQ